MAAPDNSRAGIREHKTGRTDKGVRRTVRTYLGIQADDKLDQPFQSHQLQQKQSSQNHEEDGNSFYYP